MRCFNILKEVRLRSYVVLQLGYLLIERQHSDVVGRPASFLMRERFRTLQRSYASAVEVTYPSSMYGGDGAVPPEILQAVKDACGMEEASRSKADDYTPFRDKQAAPSVTAEAMGGIWNDCRPQAVLEERSHVGLGDVNDQLLNALRREDTLRIRTGNEFQNQFTPQFVSRACPWSLPFMVGGT